MSFKNFFSKFSSNSRMSRKVAKLNNKQSVLNKKLDVANLKADIKNAKKGGNVSVNKGKAVVGLLAGAMTSKHLLNTKKMEDDKKMFNKWMDSLDKREKEKTKKENK